MPAESYYARNLFKHTSHLFKPELNQALISPCAISVRPELVEGNQAQKPSIKNKITLAIAAMVLAFLSFLLAAVLELMPHKTQAKYNAEMVLLAVASLAFCVGAYPLLHKKPEPPVRSRHLNEPVIVPRRLPRSVTFEPSTPPTPAHIIHSRIVARFAAFSIGLSPVQEESFPALELV